MNGHNYLLLYRAHFLSINHRSLCRYTDVEDEYHILLGCTVYNDIRKRYIYSYFYRRPHVHKFIYVLQCSNASTIKRVSKEILWRVYHTFLPCKTLNKIIRLLSCYIFYNWIIGLKHNIFACQLYARGLGYKL